jgi:luciferase family oxidoreductase group 1
MPNPIPLSVLDLATVSTGSTEAQALRRSRDLAVHIEALGYHRFWVAEHHNIPSVASSAPDILIAEIANATSTIRVGSGGVMLPNHAPMVVAERFATLEAFHPGRIDLGLGRAPGSDQRTMRAVRRAAAGSDDEFIHQLGELTAFFDGTFPPGHLFEGLRAIPGGRSLRPPYWLLGSSDYSARAAALLSQRFGFAYHFSAQTAPLAMRLYREMFRPSEELPAPQALLTVGVICADTEAEAVRLSSSMALGFARLRTGNPQPLASPDEVEAHAWTETEQALAPRFLDGYVVGAPEQVAERLGGLARDLQADELMLATPVWDPQAQKHSFALVKAAMDARAKVAA